VIRAGSASSAGGITTGKGLHERAYEALRRIYFPAPASRRILGMRVDATTYEDASKRIVAWAMRHESRYICVATVNNAMEAHDDPAFSNAMNGADLVTADGMPLVWGLRLLGVKDASRVYGPDLTPHLLAKAAKDGVPVGFYGGAPDALETLILRVQERWPELRVAYRHSPPFTHLTPAEEERVVENINESGARILFVGLGCPKQEWWMALRRDRVQAVMVGVGAAFDFLAGTKKQAPHVLQRLGLEWVFRLLTEPRRLWRRYLKQNPRFLVLFGAQVLRKWFDRTTSYRSGSKEE
jgi:N-acetylglucosaminyldiphosphoundecaprenol N-acetyl-beta-D-mannosaminyltransferase